MSDHATRRDFLRGAAAAGLFAAGAPAKAQEHEHQEHEKHRPPARPRQDHGRHAETPQDDEDFGGFSRYRPTRGHDPDADFYLGKLVPARGTGDGTFLAPDLAKLPYEVVDGWKVFRLVPQHVRRELLPGNAMDFYGYNGSMPGPTIEAVQGDKVRVIVKNELPEPTTVHWHGLELEIQYDGADTLTQNPIPPGGEFVYEFHLHEAGTFFYHSHDAMQETFGAVGWLIVHPAEPWAPAVDRDFGLIFQNFDILPSQTVPDSWAMEWHWHTINGRSGPFTTPLVVRHGERVRIRIMDFSPMQHHPIHLHGHTFWVTGHEGARAPKSAWVPRNNELIAVAQASVLEFVANNPGDWMLHCHMTHHMMNHMVRHVGPRIREGRDVTAYMADLETRPPVKFPHTDPGYDTPGYPQSMMLSHGMMSEAALEPVLSRREVQGMRQGWPMAVMGLMTVVRVLPDDLYDRVMLSDEPIPPGAVFEEIVRRFGDPAKYQAPKGMHAGHGGAMPEGHEGHGGRTMRDRKPPGRPGPASDPHAGHK